jgi:hypothetical protein
VQIALPFSSKRWLFGLVFFLASTVLSLFLPSLAHAQTVGTHLGEGDITFQVKIMDILATNGARDGFPVTVMVSSNNTQSEIDALAAGAKRNNFLAIVRINDVCIPTDAARVVGMVRQAFGPEAPIEWGNEVNNQAVECTNYSSYSTEYSAIKGLPNVGPAALDFYNSDYPADNFPVSFDGDDVYFANAYGCIGTTVGSCNPETTTTQDIGMAYAKAQGRFYLTEFSLSPSGGGPGGGDIAPDTNLLNVITFIETQASKTGATAITPLIRNVCNDDGDWLLYLDGKILTRNGATIDPATCSPDSSKASYYLYPIQSLQDAVTQNLGPQAAGAEIAKELINQGYEVSCTNPEGLFRASMENWEDYERYVDPSLTSLPDQIMGFTQTVNYQDVKYPLFRAGQTADSVNDSIEAHFGYLETDPVLDEIGRETKSAALYKLLSLEQQCDYQKKILQTIHNMCDKLEDPSACALYQPIPGTAYTTETLYQSLQNDDLSCAAEDRLKASAEDQKRYQALSNTPLYLDKAYRLGFIVFSAQQRGSINNNNNGWDFLFNGNDPSGQPEHEVRIVAFKLPDIGTNKDRSSDIYYDDPLAITRDSLTTPQEQKKRIEEYQDKREEFLKGNEFASNLSFPSNEALINCSGPACNDALGRALVNLVNSGTDNFDQTCQLDEKAKQKLITQVDESEEINVSGNLNLDTVSETPTTPEDGLGTFFKNGFQLLTNLFRQPPEAKTDPQSFELKGTSSIDPNQYAHGAYVSAAKFNAYLIYPVGYEYDQVVDTLAGAIKTDEELAELADPEKVAPYFMLDGVDQNFESTIATTEYFLDQGEGDCAVPGPIVDPVTGELIPAPPGTCPKKIEYKAIGYINDNDGDDATDSIEGEPRVKGGLLGQVMQDIQLSLRRVGSNAWYYIESCETTEQFLLGQCDENAAANSQDGDELAGQCKELYGASGTNSTMTVYDRQETFKRVVAAAQRAAASGKLPAGETKRFAQTLWGVLEIEGSPYLRVMRTTADGTTSSINCAETINSCGAVGPLQIIQGACVTDSCSFSDLNLLRKFDRPDNLCDLNTALDWTASNLLTHYDPAIANIDERHAAMAGNHAGLGACTEAFSQQPIGGCNALNYCDCASFGFSDRFDDMWALWGSEAATPNASVTIN